MEWIKGSRLRARARVCVCVCVCVRACVRACLRTCVHACMRACVRACVSLYIYGSEVLYIFSILKVSRLAECVCERERERGGFDPRTPFDVFCTFI